MRTTCLLLLATALAAADPRIVPDATPPVKWSVPDGTNVAWQAEPGFGVSCPAVFGDLVVILAEPETVVAYKQDDGTEAWRHDFCIFDEVKGADAAKGKEALLKTVAFWRAGVKRKKDDRIAEAKPFWAVVEAAKVPLLRADSYESYGWTHGEPVTDGKLLYVQFGTGTTAAIDPAGTVVWRKRFLVGAAMPAASAPPLVVDGKLIFKDSAAKDERAKGRNIVLVAVEAATGKPLWRSKCLPESDHGGWAGMCTATVDDKTVILTPGGCAIDPADGRILVEDLGNTRYGARPSGGAGVAAYGGFVVPLAAEGDAIAKLEGTRLDRDDRANGLVATERIYTWPDKKHFGIFDLAGKELWKGKINVGKGKGGNPKQRLALAGKYVVIPGPGGVVGMVDVSGDQAKVVAQNPTGNVNATPAAAGSRLFLRTGAKLVAVGK